MGFLRALFDNRPVGRGGLVRRIRCSCGRGRGRGRGRTADEEGKQQRRGRGLVRVVVVRVRHANVGVDDRALVLVGEGRAGGIADAERGALLGREAGLGCARH